MEFFSDIWGAVTGVFEAALRLLHDAVFFDIFGDEVAWGWSIIALTLVIRVALLPMATKQARSMRAMQELSPRIKELQGKHKVDRDLMRKDPELYRKRKEAQNKALMELYQEEGVNPASSCLPLVLQAPVFIALFSVLRGTEDLRDADFYFVTSAIGPDAAGSGLGALVSQAGWPGWVLIGAMVLTMFITQKQTMSRTPVEGPAAQQQKIMLYVMPAFLAFISRTLPLGVILYWVTSNIWQGVQQYIIFRDAQGDDDDDRKGRGAGRGSRGASWPARDEDASANGRSARRSTATPAEPPKRSRPARKKGAGGAGGHLPPRTDGRGSSSSHLPSRRTP